MLACVPCKMLCARLSFFHIVALIGSSTAPQGFHSLCAHWRLRERWEAALLVHAVIMEVDDGLRRAVLPCVSVSSKCFQDLCCLCT
jgi:hypothetical protein